MSSDTQAANNTPENTQMSNIMIRRQYAKDISLEIKRAYELSRMTTSPTIELSINIGSEKNIANEEPNHHLSSIRINIVGKDSKNSILFLVELLYLTVIEVDAGLQSDMLDYILEVDVAYQSFPFARAIVANLTGAAGLAPVMISPVNFLGIYTQKRLTQPRMGNATATTVQADNTTSQTTPDAASDVAYDII